MTFAYEGFWFCYAGGQYIDIHVDGESVPFDCINVMSMDGRKLIKPGRKGFEARCKRWFKEAQTV